MAGVFTIKPRNQSNVTCSLGEDKTNNYYVVQESIVLNESQRIKVAYSDAEVGGQVSGLRSGLVPIQFDVWIFGSTMEDRLNSLRLLTWALTDEDGGYIQYRPRGLSDTVLSTYYHYLTSAPPQIDSHIRLSDASPPVVQAGRSPGSPAILCRCQVMTKAWATSDPDNVETIVSTTTLDNIDDANDENHVTIQSNQIKGDVLFPIIRIEENTTTYFIDRIFIHKRKMRLNNNDRLDVIEGEDYDDSSGTVSTASDASYSGGEALSVSIGSGNATVYYAIPALDSSYHGNILPILFADLAAGDQWTVQVAISAKGTAGGDDYADVRFLGSKTFDENVTGLFYMRNRYEEFQYPISDVPFFINDDSTPSLADWASDGLYLRILFQRVAGSGTIHLDFIYLAKTDEYFSMLSLESPKELALGDIVVSSFDDVAYQESPSGGYHAPVSQTVPASGLIMKNGYDYRLSFFAAAGGVDNSFGYWQDDMFDVTVTGIYGTIYPFNES